MCRPLATGSRQASRTISARCRGGNPGGSPGASGAFQEAGQLGCLVATTDPPDRRAVTLRADGQTVDRLPVGDTQDDPCPLDLEPGEGSTAGDLLQDRGIVGRDPQSPRSSTTHGGPPVAEIRQESSVPAVPNLLHYLRPGTLGTVDRKGLKGLNDDNRVAAVTAAAP